MRVTQPAPGAPRHRRSTTAAHVRTSATGRERVVALDGLRAFALLIIMGYHFGVGWLQGGFFSLDIFYVLSGYLITGLLLGEWARAARIKLGAFWLRRARRLLPALLVVLVVVSLVVRFAYPPGLYPDFRMSALSALFYFSNWWQIAASGNYFVATGAVSPLTHTWSLAVEEQFYLVWPLVVVAVLHLGKRFSRGIEILLGVSVVGVVASATEMAWLYNPLANTTRLYFGTDTHAQSILVGAALACVLTLVQRRRGRVGMAPVATSPTARGVLTVVGLAGVAGTLTLTYALTGTVAFDYRGGFLLSALSAAAIVVGSVCVPGGPLARVLSLRPMVWMGTVSYGAYLWHFPVFIELDAARTGLTGLVPPGRAVRHHLRPGRTQLLPGRAAGDGGDLLAVAAGGVADRPGHGGHRGRHRGRHGDTGHRGRAGPPVPTLGPGRRSADRHRPRGQHGADPRLRAGRHRARRGRPWRTAACSAAGWRSAPGSRTPRPRRRRRCSRPATRRPRWRTSGPPWTPPGSPTPAPVTSFSSWPEPGRCRTCSVTATGGTSPSRPSNATSWTRCAGRCGSVRPTAPTSTSPPCRPWALAPTAWRYLRPTPPSDAGPTTG